MVSLPSTTYLLFSFTLGSSFFGSFFKLYSRADTIGEWNESTWNLPLEFSVAFFLLKNKFCALSWTSRFVIDILKQLNIRVLYYIFVLFWLLMKWADSDAFNDLFGFLILPSAFAQLEIIMDLRMVFLQLALFGVGTRKGCVCSVCLMLVIFTQNFRCQRSNVFWIVLTVKDLLIFRRSTKLADVFGLLRISNLNGIRIWNTGKKTVKKFGIYYI